MALVKAALAIALGGALLIPAATVSSGAPGAASSSAVVAGAHAGEALAATTAHRVVLDCAHRSQVRPRTYVLACGDGNNYLASMAWSSWAANQANGKGSDVANDCLPYCAAGHFHRFPVDVVLSRPRAWAGHRGVERFTRLTLVYPGTRPAGAPRQETYTLP